MTATEWRGRLDEVDDDLPIDEAVPRRREARALLGSLLRPYRLTVGLLAVVVIAENAARLASARAFVDGQRLGCDGNPWEGDWWTVF